MACYLGRSISEYKTWPSPLPPSSYFGGPLGYTVTFGKAMILRKGQQHRNNTTYCVTDSYIMIGDKTTLKSNFKNPYGFTK